MTEKLRLVLITLSMLLVYTGCTTRLVDFTIISTKNVDLSKGASFSRGNQRVEGVDTVYIIIIIPTGVANMKEAIDRAIESVPGAVALLDGVLYRKNWWIPFIFGSEQFVIEGTPLIDPALVPQKTSFSSSFYLVKMNEAGSIDASQPVSAAEYEAVRWALK